jgi:DNA-binding NarL/FixJ family response regulator
VRIVAVTIHDEYSVIRRMLDAGVHGYVLKSAAIDELVTAIERVWRRETYVSPAVEEIIRQAASKAVVLTKPEQHILRYVCEGLSNPEIAKRMNLSSETVKWYRKRLLAKFGVKNTVSLVSLVLKEHILPDCGA